LWRSGEYQTPETFVEYQLADSPNPVRVAVEPLTFRVPSVLDPNDTRLRPLKPQIDLAFLPWFAVLIPIVGVIVLVVLMRLRTGKRLTLPPVAASSSPLDRYPLAARTALSALTQLRDYSVEPLTTYTRIAEVLRQYIHDRFQVPADQMTTTELGTALVQQPVLPERQTQALLYLLRQADMVKFAGLKPEGKATSRALTHAYRWVELVENQPEEVVEPG
jgi:hypothetical protein